MDIDEIIEQLDAAEKKATEGPWVRDMSRDGRQNQSVGQDSEYMDCLTDTGQRISSNHIVAWKQGGRSAIPDADFICLARNHIRALIEAVKLNNGLCEIIGDIETCRQIEGNSVTILCDNPEAEAVEHQTAVEACCDFTGWKEQRFCGKTWHEALHACADAARAFYAKEDAGDQS